MTLYSLLVSLHVITAILGLGPLTILALATSSGAPTSPPVERIAQLLRLTGWSLLAMFLTGAGLIALTHGELGKTGWVRVSFGLFLLLGALHGISRRRLSRARSATPPLAPVLGALPWAMCAVVAAITYLMEAKPW